MCVSKKKGICDISEYWCSLRVASPEFQLESTTESGDLRYLAKQRLLAHFYILDIISSVRYCQSVSCGPCNIPQGLKIDPNMALEQNSAAHVHVSGDVLEDFVLIFRELLSKVILCCVSFSESRRVVEYDCFRIPFVQLTIVCSGARLL